MKKKITFANPICHPVFACSRLKLTLAYKQEPLSAFLMTTQRRFSDHPRESPRIKRPPLPWSSGPAIAMCSHSCGGVGVLQFAAFPRPRSRDRRQGFPIPWHRPCEAAGIALALTGMSSGADRAAWRQTKGSLLQSWTLIGGMEACCHLFGTSFRFARNISTTPFIHR